MAIGFQPTLPARGATFALMVCNTGLSKFQPTLPARGATPVMSAISQMLSHFNPRSPHGERRCKRFQVLPLFDFNPRSPHGERLLVIIGVGAWGVISTHAPRTGSDQIINNGKKPFAISTHAPRTGSDSNIRGFSAHDIISTHAPRTGSDFQQIANLTGIVQFQPTLPARGATKFFQYLLRPS